MEQTTETTEQLADQPMSDEGLRTEPRNAADCEVEITWKSEAGEKRFEHCRAVDITETGVAVECSEPLPLNANVIIWAPTFHVAALAEVRHCTWKRSIYVPDISSSR